MVYLLGPKRLEPKELMVSDLQLRGVGSFCRTCVPGLPTLAGSLCGLCTAGGADGDGVDLMPVLRSSLDVECISLKTYIYIYT